MSKHLTWAITLLLIISILCGTLIYLNEHAWTISFEMDNNTREAVTAIDWADVSSGMVQRSGNAVFLHYSMRVNDTIFLLQNDTYVEVEIK